ncbi:MAG: FAD-dependent oxidoreductase [Actinomycetota bacterium]|nr:FAD-dependent oxidoreductase [Actinomycetota bacterium]
MSNILEDNHLKAKYVIIGNSAAGLSCAEGIRSGDKKAKIMILTNEKFDNYSKPLISYFLAGKIDLKNIFFKDHDFYKKHSLTLLKDFNVKKINFRNKEILSWDDKKVIYEKLCIAAGGVPIIPQVELAFLSEKEEPGNNSNDSHIKHGRSGIKSRIISEIDIKNIDGIFTFTTMDDSLKIKKYVTANKIKESVILGGGLIGLKSAESLLSLGIRINIIEMSGRLLPSSFDKTASEIYEKAFRDKKSSVSVNKTIKRVYIKNNKVVAVETGDGKVIYTDMLVIAAGVKPNIDFIDEETEERKNLVFLRGIKTDKYMRTEVRDVFAAGDIVENKNVLKNSIENIAIWPLAVRQGMAAGQNMAGFFKEYSGGFPMNSVEIFDIPGVAIGITNPDNFDKKHLEIITDYNRDLNVYKKIVIFENKIIGVLLIGNIERAGIFSGLITNKVNVGKIKDLLLKDDFGVIQLPAEYKKHLVTGDAVAL